MRAFYKAFFAGAFVVLPPPPTLLHHAGFRQHLGVGSDIALNIVDNNAALIATIGPNPKTVYRAGFSTPGDGGAQWYSWSVSNCAVADNGAQVQPSATGCWIASSGFESDIDVRVWGAVADGTTDSTAAINACLVAQASKGSCFAQARYHVTSAVSLPAHAILKCGSAEPMTFGAGWNTIPAILFNTAVSPAIKATGVGAAIQGCAFLPSGITFPIASYSGFGSGVVIDDQGNGDFQLTDSVITGADSALHVTGNRPYVNHVNADGTGNTEGVIRWDVANTDSGAMGNVELAQGYFWSGGGAGCPAGTGIYVGGTPIGAAGVFMFGKIVSEGYLTADFTFQNSAIAQVLWADDFEATCGYHGYNIQLLGDGAFLTADQVTAAQGDVGIFANKNTTLQLGTVFIEATNTSGLQIGSGTGAAHVQIANLSVVGVVSGIHQIWNNSGGALSYGVCNANVAILQLQSDVSNPYDGASWIAAPACPTPPP